MATLHTNEVFNMARHLGAVPYVTNNKETAFVAETALDYLEALFESGRYTERLAVEVLNEKATRLLELLNEESGEKVDLLVDNLYEAFELFLGWD